MAFSRPMVQDAPWRELLADDAFKLPERKFEEEKKSQDIPVVILLDGYRIPAADYKQLYKDKPIWGYKKKEVKESKDAPKTQEDKKEEDIEVNAKKYQAQIYTLIDAIKKWGQGINPNTGVSRIEADILENIDTFKANLFHPNYSGDQTAKYFIIIKQNLEKIWFALEKKKNIPEKEKIKEMRALCEQIGSCPSGAYTYIAETAFRLNHDLSIEFVLALMRKNSTDMFAERYCKEHKISEVNGVHVNNLLYAYSEGMNWGPLVKIDEITERYGAEFLRIDEDALCESFRTYFEGSYTPQAILDCISMHFISEVNKQKDRTKVKESKDGWMHYNQAFYDKTKELTDSLGCAWEDIFERAEDVLYWRFDSHLFKDKLLKLCQEKGKFFTPAYWSVNTLLNGYKINRFHDKFIWIATPDNKVLDWKNLPKDVNGFELLIDIIPQLRFKNEWEAIKEARNFIKTSADFAKLLSVLKDEEQIRFFLYDFLGKDYIKDIIKKDPDFFQSHSSLAMATITLSNDYKMNRLHDDIMWLVTPDNKILDWKSLPQNVNGVELLMDIIPSLQSEQEWEAIKDAKDFIKTGADLAKLLSALSDQEQVLILLDKYLGENYLENIIKKDPEFFKALDSLAPEEQWKKDFILSHFFESIMKVFGIRCYGERNFENLLLQVIGSDDTASFRKIAKMMKIDMQKALSIAANNNAHGVTRLVVAEYGAKIERLKLSAFKDLDSNTTKTLIDLGFDFTKVAPDEKHSPLEKIMASENWECISIVLNIKPSSFNVASVSSLRYGTRDKRQILNLVNYGNFTEIDILLKYATPEMKIEFLDALQSVINTGMPVGRVCGLAKIYFKYSLDFGDNSLEEAQIRAASDPRYHEVTAIMVGLDPLKPEEKGLPAILIALKRDDMRAFQLLIKYGAYIDVKDKDGQTPISIALKAGRQDLVATMLKVPFKEGDSLLRNAIENNSPIAVRLLAEHKLDLNQPFEDGHTPLTLAASKNANEIVEILAKNRADLHAKNKMGQTAADIAYESKNYRAIKTFASYMYFSKQLHDETFIKRDLEQNDGKMIGAMLLCDDVNPKSNLAKHAAACDDVVLLKLLKRNGISLNGVYSEYGFPPVRYAVVRGSLDALNLLCEEKVDLSDVTIDDAMEASRNKIEMACLLAKQGKDFKSISKYNELGVEFLLELKPGDKAHLHLESLQEINKNKNRKTLKSNLCNYIDSIKDKSEQRRILESVINSENLLGEALNTPAWQWGFRHTKKTFRGKPVTGTIYSLTQRYKEILGSAEFKSAPSRKKT